MDNQIKIHNGINLLINDPVGIFELMIYENGYLIFNDKISTVGNIKYQPFQYKELDYEVFLNKKLILKDSTKIKQGDKFYIIFSNGLGDCISAIPQILEFKRQKQCEIFIFTIYNELFVDSFPELNFISMPKIKSGEEFRFSNIDNPKYILQMYQHDLANWRKQPLAKFAADQLGIEYKQLKCNLSLKPNKISKNKYIAISSGSTILAKEWNNPSGWEELCLFLICSGYEIYDFCQDPAFKMDGVIQIKDKNIREVAENIKGADFFIGLSSGISWLAWALDMDVFMIGGFTNDFHEFPCYRIQNYSVCHGCCHDYSVEFPKKTPETCPKNKNFECTTSISSKMVIDKIKESGLLSVNKID